MSVNQLIARGGVPVDTSGTRGQIAQMQQVDQYRNTLMQREDAQLSREQAQSQQAQQSIHGLIEEAESAFEQGGYDAVRPFIGRLAEHNPQLAQAVDKSYRDEPQKQPGALYKIDQGGKPVYAPADQAMGATPWQEPDKPQAPVKPGYGAPQAGLNPATGKPGQYLVDDAGNVKWLDVQPVPDSPRPIDVAKTRKEFRALPTVKDYETALPLLVSARKAPDNGFGDLQLIYTAGKILDPGSVVREGELALTVAAGSPLQRAIGQTRFSTENGGRLTKETRKQLLDMLNERVLAYRQGYDRDYQQYAEYAQTGGMVPRDVVGRHAANAYQGGKAAAPAKKEAPPQAVEYLKAHPETKAAFQKKYGYLPK
jgi:hypothetical protein